MIAEIPIHHRQRKAICKVVGGCEKSLIVTVPTYKNKTIHLKPNYIIEIVAYTDDYVIEMKGKFVGHITHEETMYAHIVMDSIKSKPNERKEKRQNVELPGSVFEKGLLTYSSILDVSNNGVRIETRLPILHKSVNLRISSSVVVRAEIMWSKKVNGMYYHGLKLIY